MLPSTKRESLQIASKWLALSEVDRRRLNLGGGDVAVAEELLDLDDVHAGVQEQGWRYSQTILDRHLLPPAWAYTLSSYRLSCSPAR